MLTIFIERVCADAAITTTDIAGIVLSIGPGSYTGLRVGSSVARGLSMALDIPIITIDTLHAHASRYFDGSDRVIAAMIDARRDEVYMAIYDAIGECLLASQPTIVDETFYEQYLQTYKDIPLILSGTGAAKAEDLSIPNAIICATTLSAEDLVSIGWHKYQAQEFADRAYFDLNYIKSPNITISKKHKLLQSVRKNPK